MVTSLFPAATFFLNAKPRRLTWHAHEVTLPKEQILPPFCGIFLTAFTAYSDATIRIGGLDAVRTHPGSRAHNSGANAAHRSAWFRKEFFILERLAQVLGLEYRFYNASLINYDDLVGIPLPTEDRKSLHYISTASSIWDAEIVFVDEINRTKPELQNKLFPIIHEKRVQGIPLDKLRYRWAAMNPAPSQRRTGR